MNKTEIEFIKDRVSQIKMCIVGHVETIVNNVLLPEEISNEELHKMLIDGSFTVKEFDYYDDFWSSKRSGFPLLRELFEFEETEAMKKAKAFNVTVRNKRDEFVTEVELEANRIVDKVVLGIVEKIELPSLLSEFAKMQDDFAL